MSKELEQKENRQEEVINCPSCNSLQSFAARERQRNDGKTEVFIGCRMCKWEQILYVGTKDKVKIKKDIDSLKGKVLRGDPLGSVLEERQRRLAES